MGSLTFCNEVNSKHESHNGIKFEMSFYVAKILVKMDSILPQVSIFLWLQRNIYEKYTQTNIHEPLLLAFLRPIVSKHKIHFTLIEFVFGS